MNAFFGFPTTPHLAWLGKGMPRGDKLLAPPDVEALLSEDLVIEEKVDGANLGFSVNDDGDLRIQNRGGYLSRDAAHPQFRPLWAWLATRREALTDALWPDLLLFGEWCFAAHSIHYTNLPDWFLGFDIYDCASGRFWDAARRNALLGVLGVSVVPRIASGRCDMQDLKSLLGPSHLTDGPMEGIVVRREANGWLTARAKLVDATFTQSISTHWSRGALVQNQIEPPPRFAPRT